MTERIQELEDKEQEIKSNFSLPAWTPSEVPKNKSGSQRRQEDAICALLDVRRRIAYLRKRINEYITVLDDAPIEGVRHKEKKIMLLQMKYQERRPWDAIAAEVFGEEPDFCEKGASYIRKAHRLHDAACRDIWIFWGR